MTAPVTFGILGCARITRRAIIPALQKSPAAKLRGIASREAGTARAWADEFQIPVAHDSYDALLADPSIDAVYIPLPNELHLPWVLAAAAAGKHVLCEKPLARTAAEAEEIVDGCRRHGVLLMEAFMWRHHPRVAHAQAMLAAGQLGTLRQVKMDFSLDIARTDWRLDPRRGGGALFDLGCYGINAARLFTAAEPLEIFARTHRYETGVDMTTGMLLRFPGDVVALLDASFESPDRNRIELVGTRGSLEFPNGVLPTPETELIYCHAAGVETIRFAAADQYAGQIECFCASIAAGRLLPPAEDGLANMRVVDAVLGALSQQPSAAKAVN